MDKIMVTSLRGADEHGRAHCQLDYGDHRSQVPVDDIRTTAEDLFLCGAYADLIGELLRAGLDSTNIAAMVSGMLSKRGRRQLGTDSTLSPLPAGSSQRRAGAVLLTRGADQGHLTPDEARTMGRVWFQAADAADSDTAFYAVLRSTGWLTEAQIDALFGLLRDVRSGYLPYPPVPAEKAS